MANKLVQLKDKNKNNIFSVPYFPIGYIYLSTSSINPSEIFGGTWEPIKDRFLLLAGDTYKGGQTGGEATHKLTVNEMPRHFHNMGVLWGQKGGYGRVTGGNPSTGADRTNIQGSDVYTGGDQAHNNMPPYIVVYGWVKVSN